MNTNTNPTRNAEISHAEIVGPAAVHRHPNEIEMADEFARTLYVASWPPQFRAGLLDKLHTAPGASIEVAIHQTPVPRETSIKNYEDAIRDLKGAIAEQEKRGSARLRDTKQRLHQHEDTKDELQNGEQQIHHVAVYITLRAATVEQLDSLENTVRNELTPTQVSLKRVTRVHDKGITSTSPVAKDELNKTNRMKSGALATLYPFSSDTILEEGGALYGYHAVTDAPVMVDRFARENGYNMILSGKTGDGKSFGAKLIMLRERIRDPDTLFVVVDPLSDFTRFVQQLEGEDVSIGGTKGLNPLDIRPTPPRVLARKPDLNPFGKKVDGVLAFFNDFFERRDVAFDHDVTVLELAVAEAYARAGITKDIETHDNPSPTIREVGDRPSVRGILKEIANDPEAFIGDTTADERQKFTDAASDVRMELLPFEEGQPYAHLGGTSDITISEDSSVVNLDMQQAEQRGDVGLMMQELLDTVYELSKETTKQVVLCIDESHLLLNNEHSLDWLDRVTRHARHHDLSLMLLTQKIEDYLSSEKRRTILGNCSVQMHWREDKLSPDHAEALGLTSREAEFVRQAKPGDWDRGYSHALCVVDGDRTYPTKITALKEEARLIDEDLAKRFGEA
jgi:Cdc6-like AAA superfamily ATPase